MPRVFISYSHDNDAHKLRVGALADRLKADGVDIVLDRDCGAGGPNEGWDKWSEQQADRCEIVLPVFTPDYRKCWDGEQPPGMRLGATHEIKVLYRRLYEAGGEIGFCRIITFEDDHRNVIPTLLQGLPSFDAQKGYAEILGWLTNLGAVSRPKAGESDIAWPSQLPQYRWPLADRVEVFESFHNTVTRSASHRILLIEGHSNTGKTVLLNELFNFAKAIPIPSVLLDLKGCPALGELFELLALDIGADILPAFHSASGSARKTALLKDLENLRRPLLLGFDTYQHVAPDIADWIEGQFLRRTERCPGLMVIIAGQTIPDATRHAWHDLALPCRLEPIRETHYWHEYAERVLGSQLITEDHIEMLLHISQGDPGHTSALLRSFAKAGQR